MPDPLKDLIDRIADLQASLDLLNIQERDLIAKHVPKQALETIDDIHAEFEGKRLARKEDIEELKGQAKQAVLEAGQTMKGEFLQAVYRNGETTWDTDLLMALSALYPAILKAKKTGKPSVTFRPRGG